MRKLEDIIIYHNEDWYSAFPSVVCCPDGELLTAFRRAPERRKYFAADCRHCDPNSYLVLSRSNDFGRTWSKEPELIYAHPLGGSQDPCMIQLDDGSLLLSSYAWMLLPQEGIGHAEPGLCLQAFGWTFTFLGGYLLKSSDRGRAWQGPIVPPPLDDEAPSFPGIRISPMNRGAMVQACDGNLYWIVARHLKSQPDQTVIALLTSCDRGKTWKYVGLVAADDKVIFNETSLVETVAGDLVAFVRTGQFDDRGVMVRSQDHGKTWDPWQDMGIVGHPYHALRLPDGRIFLSYGYRHQPFGIRARLLDPEGRDFSGDEIILRNDGGVGDLGYPWSCLTADGRILCVYYFNRSDGTRFIAGTFLAID